jgi:hypothetical protein
MDNKITENHEGKRSKTQLIVAFILGLIVGVVVAPTFFGNDSVEEFDTSREKENEGKVMSGENPLTKPTNFGVAVIDQLAGDRVLLEEVTFETSGWAVVHEDIDGAPGNALGAQRFDGGTRTDGYVELLRNTESGNLYYVILYLDDGDGEFDLKKDAPISSEEGIVSTTFKTVTIDRKNN